MSEKIDDPNELTPSLAVKDKPDENDKVAPLDFNEPTQVQLPAVVPQPKLPALRGESALILANEDEMLNLIRNLDADKASKAILRIKRDVREKRADALRAGLTSKHALAGGGVGSAVGSAALVAIATPAVVATPLLVGVAAGGFVVAALGFAVSYWRGGHRIRLENSAQHLEDIITEAEKR